MVIQDNMPAFNLSPVSSTVTKELIYKLIKMASSILTLKHSGVLMHRTNNTKFISPIDQRKKGRVVNHGRWVTWVCIYVMVYCSLGLHKDGFKDVFE